MYSHFHVCVHDVLGDAVDGFTQTQDVIGMLGGHGDLVLDIRIQDATHIRIGRLGDCAVAALTIHVAIGRRAEHPPRGVAFHRFVVAGVVP